METDNLGPRGRQSREAKGQDKPFNMNDYALSLDMEAFNTLVQNNGILVTHYRAVLDPTGMVSRGDIHDALGNRQSSDGHIYEPVGICRALFLSNNNKVSQEALGLLAFSTAYMTFPQNYEDSEEPGFLTSQDPILISPYDRFYIRDIELRVVNKQFVEANSNGIDRLQYPATCIEHIIDANGIRYVPEVDFSINKDGNVVWKGNKRPGWNANLNKGVIYSVRYRYTPFFICSALLHEIRITHTSDVFGQRSTQRAPYQIQVMRENVFRDTNQGDPNKPGFNDERYQDAPPVGGRLGR